jgi:transposase-like protein
MRLSIEGDGVEYFAIAFALRSIAFPRGEFPYVYLDGVVLKRSWGGEVRNISVLVAIGIGTDGFRRIPGVAEDIAIEVNHAARSSVQPLMSRRCRKILATI